MNCVELGLWDFVETRLIASLQNKSLSYNQLRNFPLEGESKGVLISLNVKTGLTTASKNPFSLLRSV